MPSKKNKSRKEIPDKIPSANTSHQKKLPEKSSDENRYEGYDEERTSYNTGYESDYDVDENDIKQRSEEYNNYDSGNAEKISKKL